MDFKEFTYRYGLSLNDKQTEAVKAVDGPVLLLYLEAAKPLSWYRELDI